MQTSAKSIFLSNLSIVNYIFAHYLHIFQLYRMFFYAIALIFQLKSLILQLNQTEVIHHYGNKRRSAEHPMNYPFK